MLCTDGAQCYAKLARELKVQHFQCNHSQNQFVLRKRRRSGALSVHTGTIDNAWRLLKQAVPKSLASKKGHTYNPALIKHCRSWQWRWENTGTSLFQKTAKVLNETVQSRWLSLAIEKNARRNVLKPAYFKKTAKKWRWFWKLMNAENIAKGKKKAKTQWHGEYHELNCLPKPCVSHPMSRIWTPKTDKTWVQFPTRRDVWLPQAGETCQVPSLLQGAVASDP